MQSHSFRISGQVVDVAHRRIFPAEVLISDGVIGAVQEKADAAGSYLLPGFVDAHVHIESTLLSPAEAGRMMAVHGTVATVSDPHEIANVCGVPGVEWMLENARQSPVPMLFGAPSSVPATGFETAGARLDAPAVEALLARPDIGYLAEVMNYPGVLKGDADLLRKIASAKRHGKPVDGHAPGLRGADAARYAAAGPTTDHECTTLNEALDKIAAGMHILIREGSAARNFDALHPLLRLHSGRVMFCSDDKHPDSLLEGHIDALVRPALALGNDLFDVLHAACVLPVHHYRLSAGFLRPGDPATFIVADDLRAIRARQTYIDGALVAEAGRCLVPRALAQVRPVNNFRAAPRAIEDFRLPCKNPAAQLRVICAEDGQLVTSAGQARGKAAGGEWLADVENDLLKLTVISRYKPRAKPAVAFVRGFGLKRGALASTVAHDSHNIIAVGTDDASLCAAVNAVIETQGGLAAAFSGTDCKVLPLPVAGLMSDGDGWEVARHYTGLDAAAKSLGTGLSAPFMTLSFLALLVIPSLKLSDRGLFDGQAFSFVPVEV